MGGTGSFLLGVAILAAALAGCASHGREASTSPTPSTTTSPAPSSPPPPPPPPAFVGGFSNTSVFPGAYKMSGKFSRVLDEGPYGIGEEHVENLAIGQRGANVQIGYVLPKDPPAGSKFPAIVQASVYYGKLVVGSLRTSHTSNPEHSVDFLLDNYVPHGYAVVLVPVRGAAGNGGCYEWWSADEKKDLQAAIDWIKAQAWSDGNLGFFGLSLAGSAAWMAAGLGDPAVKTIVPISSETDLYSWFVRNGTPSLLAAPFGTPAFWFLYSVSPYSASQSPKPQHDPARTQDGLSCPGLADALAASEYMTLTGAGNDPRGYIAARDLRPAVEANYKGSVFLVTGLNDWLGLPHLVYPWLDELESNGVVVKHLLGQWRHRMPDDPTGAPYFQPTQRVDFAETLLHWFDYWLKNETTRDLGPRVQVADSNLTWRKDVAWPPNSTNLRLYPGAQLAESPPASASALLSPDPTRAIVRSDEIGPTPRQCPTCNYYETPAGFASDLRFEGIPHLRVKATPTGPGGSVTAYLYVRDGDEYQRVGWATMDLRFAHSATPATLIPGTAITADLEFEPLAVSVPAGGSLVLELFQGGYGEDIQYFPAQALAPAAYYRSSIPNDPVIVNLGADTYLDLPRIQPSATQYFEAPKAVS